MKRVKTKVTVTNYVILNDCFTYEEAVAMEVCESREEPRNAMGQMEDDSVVHMEIDHKFIAIQGLLDDNKVVFGDAERGC